MSEKTRVPSDRSHRHARSLPHRNLGEQDRPMGPRSPPTTRLVLGRPDLRVGSRGVRHSRRFLVAGAANGAATSPRAASSRVAKEERLGAIIDALTDLQREKGYLSNDELE